MSSLLIPRFLYINTETEMMMTYGKPEAKFNNGIQYQGLLSVFIAIGLGWLIYYCGRTFIAVKVNVGKGKRTMVVFFVAWNLD